MWLYHSLSVLINIDGYLGWFHFGVIMNDASTNTESKTLCEHISKSLVCINSNKISVSYSNSTF